MAPEVKDKKLKLPMSVSSPADISRLIRELNSLENLIMQNQMRSPDENGALPKITSQLSSLAEHNNLDLSARPNREKLQKDLQAIKNQAPIVHISFSSEPNANFLEKITTWFRQETHPDVLLRVGLQPNIAVGCIVRTPNKQFDFSLGKDLLTKSESLISKFSLKDEETSTGAFIPVQSAPEEQQ